jgi:hypothetical protein
MKKNPVISVLYFVVFFILIAATFPGCGNPKPTPPSPTVNPTTISQAPVITGLTAPAQAEALSLAAIQCVAVGSDNLTYQWTASSGTIIGTGNNVNWKAPDAAGDSTVKVVVANSKGETATKSVTITVTARPAQAPVVKSFTVTRTGQPPVTIPADSPTPIQISKFRPALIVADVEDPSGGTLSFMWASSFGTIEGANNSIKWTTAQDSNKQGDCILTVTAISSKGGRAKAQMIIHIPCCAD